MLDMLDFESLPVAHRDEHVPLPEFCCAGCQSQTKKKEKKDLVVLGGETCTASYRVNLSSAQLVSSQ